VGYKHDAAPFIAELTHNIKEFVHLPVCQCRCRFIHDDYFAVVREGLGDLHHLHLGNRKIPHHPVDIQINADPGQ
jgi:hypothetical protein